MTKMINTEGMTQSFEQKKIYFFLVHRLKYPRKIQHRNFHFLLSFKIPQAKTSFDIARSNALYNLRHKSLFHSFCFLAKRSESNAPNSFLRTEWSSL